jgi:hypothetical protein
MAALGRVPGGAAMQNFIHRKNLEHYRKLLAETSDAAKRQQLLKLLAEEEGKEPLPLRAKDEA